jgi:hypothetical protein
MLAPTRAVRGHMTAANYAMLGILIAVLVVSAWVVLLGA